MSYRFSMQYNRCCIDTFKAHEDVAEVGRQIICFGCDSRYVLGEDNIWKTAQEGD